MRTLQADDGPTESAPLLHRTRRLSLGLDNRTAAPARALRSARSIGNISVAATVTGAYEPGFPDASILADDIGSHDDSDNWDSPSWRIASWPGQPGDPEPTEECDDAGWHDQDDLFESLFARELRPQAQLADTAWEDLLKHFVIGSTSGDLIWSRHRLTNSAHVYLNVIIKCWQICHKPKSRSELQSFTIGPNRRVSLLAKNGALLISISSLGESDSQLKAQLESLYGQLVSIFTEPWLVNAFKLDMPASIRRNLHGSVSMLRSLTDGFTDGSPTSLLSAIESFFLRKTHRRVVDKAFLESRHIPVEPRQERAGAVVANVLVKTMTLGLVSTERPPTAPVPLLYGLLVADGRLVSVVRPRWQSLHPGDHFILFNLLFKSGKVSPSQGIQWVPVCLPGYNNDGHVHVYTSFIKLGLRAATTTTTTTTTTTKATATATATATEAASKPSQQGADPASTTSEPDFGDHLSIVLVSANIDAFDQLRQMDDQLRAALARPGGGLDHIKASLGRSPLDPASFLPPGRATILSHFLYKSLKHVQFVQPDAGAPFSAPADRRRLFNIYARLHEQVHGRAASSRIYHATTPRYLALVWTSAHFEFYAVALRRQRRPVPFQPVRKTRARPAMATSTTTSTTPSRPDPSMASNEVELSNFAHPPDSRTEDDNDNLAGPPPPEMEQVVVTRQDLIRDATAMIAALGRNESRLFISGDAVF